MLVYLLKLCFVASLALAGFATAEQVSNKLGGSGDPDDAPTPSKLRTLQPPPQLLPHHPIPGIVSLIFIYSHFNPFKLQI
jgi:hypothetical protein